ncbi:STAS domain-containing protein [Actinoplanes sp. NPDC023936]|uniref:STAS domain-containing protein n=1 Tax=Actinoplanes sp. NPDC023936 TaxID=3154910 RepID=UPI0033C96D8D
MMTDHFLTATTEAVTDEVTVLIAVGEIDRDSTRVLAESVREHTGRWIVADLTGVTFCDSSGLNYLVQLHHQLAGRGGSLAVAGARDFVLRTLRVASLDRLFPLHTTVDEAVTALSAC